MYSKVVLNVFNNPKNAGRIKKPDGIADCFNLDSTAHVEFSLRIEEGIITNCQFRAQANPYIVAICSTITEMVKGKMVSMLFIDPYSIKKELGDETEMDIDFCIDCLKMAVVDYKEKLGKPNKNVNEEDLTSDIDEAIDNEEDEFKEGYNEIRDEVVDERIESNEETEQESNSNLNLDISDDSDDDFADFFDFLEDDE